MNRSQVNAVARQLGVSGDYVHAPLRAVVQEIQRLQGHEMCFLGEQSQGCQRECPWKSLCQQCLVPEWLR